MRYLIYILFALLFFGCNSVNKPKKPDNLIAKDKMSDILYDVFILNSAKGIDKKSLENNGIQPQDFLYKKHGIDSLQFALSNDYYAYDTKTYEKIIGRVIARIENEKLKYQAIEETEVADQKKQRELKKIESEKSPLKKIEFKEDKQIKN